jgi:hypothetical protein
MPRLGAIEKEEIKSLILVCRAKMIIWMNLDRELWN